MSHLVKSALKFFKSLVTKYGSDIDIIHLKGIWYIETAYRIILRDNDFNAKHNLDWYFGGDCI